jgi:hypothetical protein
METNPTPVLDRIRSGELSMRPKVYFVLRTLIVALVATLVLLLSILLVGYISFILRSAGHDSLLSFGARGLPVFLALFPWTLAAADFVLIVFLVFLLRYFRFGYRHSVLLLLATAVLVAAAAGIALDRETPFEDALFDEASHGRLPGPLDGAYVVERRHAPEELGIYRGIITSVDDTSFAMTYDDIDQDEDDASWVVILPPGVSTSTLHTGERAYVAGDADGKVIRAYGVRILQ